jgi:ribosomal protein L20A (L18A)
MKRLEKKLMKFRKELGDLISYESRLLDTEPFTKDIRAELQTIQIEIDRKQIEIEDVREELGEEVDSLYS